MRTPKLFLGIFALALILPLMLLACGGSDEQTDGTSQERSTDEPETQASPARTPSTPGSGDAPTDTDAPAVATAPPAASGSVETDREALVILYNATDGENWDGSANWLSDAPLVEWEGVSTDDDGRVTYLVLEGNGLSGEIPPELGSLSNLSWLMLNGNSLSGEIPAELGNLSNLKVLRLDNTYLSGEIPEELGNLSNLEHLGLSSFNDLSGCVPSSLEDQLIVFVLGGLPFC